MAPTHCGHKFLGFWVVCEWEDGAKRFNWNPQVVPESVLAWGCGMKNTRERLLFWAIGLTGFRTQRFCLT